MESEEGAVRAKPARPSRRNEHPRRPRSLQAPGRGPPGLTPRSALRFVGPLPRPLRALRGGPKAPRAVGRESARGRLATSPSRLPLTPRGSGKRSPWPRRDHPPAPTPAGTRAPHLTPPAGPGPRPQPRSPQAAPATLDTGNSWVPDSGSPRPPSSVNSACFSTKWRRRSRAHVAAFPLPVLISSFAARSRREGPGTGQ